MTFERGKIADLTPDEIRSQHLPAVLPRCSIGGEDASSQERSEITLSSCPQAPVLEFERLDRLQIFWFGGCDKRPAQCVDLERVCTHFGEAGRCQFQSTFLLEGRHCGFEEVVAQDWVLGWIYSHWLTSFFADHRLALAAGGEIPLYVVEDYSQQHDKCKERRVLIHDPVVVTLSSWFGWVPQACGAETFDEADEKWQARMAFFGALFKSML